MLVSEVMSCALGSLVMLRNLRCCFLYASPLFQCMFVSAKPNMSMFWFDIYSNTSNILSSFDVYRPLMLRNTIFRELN